jgi:DNA repair exonuclease SbcCD nuclease subunit
MSKILRIGDPHLQISNIKDSQKLIDFVKKIAIESNVDKIEFLGDMFHTHAVVRIEVIDFWSKNLFDLCETGKEVICLVGNHDQVGSVEKEQDLNALISLKGVHPGLRIVDSPIVIDSIGYIPHNSNGEAFFEAARNLFDLGAKELIVAHQTFTGAQYENGFFSEEGIDPGLVLQTQIISGHIHTSQQVGKCFYPGTPKWDTMADANQAKGIWIFTHNESGQYVDKIFIPTNKIVTPITSYEVKEGDEIPDLDPNARNYVVLEGQSAWINKIKKKIKDLAHIKVKPTDRVTRVNRDNTTTLEKYLESEFVPVSGVTKEELAIFLGDI